MLPSPIRSARPTRARLLLVAVAALAALLLGLVPGSAQADPSGRAGEGTARVEGSFALAGTFTQSYYPGVVGEAYEREYGFRSTCAGTKACAKVTMLTGGAGGDRLLTLKRTAPGTYKGDVDSTGTLYQCYGEDGETVLWSQDGTQNVKFSVTVTKARKGKVKTLKGTTRNTYDALDLTGAPSGCDEEYFGFPEGVVNVIAAKFTGVPTR